MKYALVPVEDINRLESARKQIREVVDLLEPRIVQSAFLCSTSSLWEFTHRKYDVVSDEYITIGKLHEGDNVIYKEKE